MSSLIFPTLPGLTFDVVRTPIWNTEKQKALSGKRSTLAYMQYPLIHFELTFSLLRDDVSPSEVQQIVGLFNAVQAGYDTFLFTDPDFNAAHYMQFATGDGVTTVFPTTATYGANGYGYGELIQNFNPFPSYQIQRYGTLHEYMYEGPRTQYVLQSQTFTSPWSLTNVSLFTSGFNAPDNVSPVIALEETTTTNVQHYISQGMTGSQSAGVYTLSLFVLAYGTPGGADCRYIYLQIADQVTSDIVTAIFDVQLGLVTSSSISIGTSFSGAVPEIVSTGQSPNFFRLSLAITKAGANACSIFITASTSPTVATFAGVIGSTCMFIWGAQYENTAAFPYYNDPPGAYPSMYLPTTTVQRTVQDIASVGATGLVTYTTAPPAGAKLLWTGSFYYRCAFDEDKLELVKFMNKWWSIKKLPFTSINL
jgi:hypothetical protein